MRTPEHVRRAEDCPPYLRSDFDKTARDRSGRRRPAARMAARQICPKAQRVGRARSPLRAALGCADLTFRFESVSAPLRARLRRAPLQGAVRAVCSRVRLYLNRLLRARAIPNFARRGSRQSIEPKAMLEHRAPKTSTPILHTGNAESR